MAENNQGIPLSEQNFLYLPPKKAKASWSRLATSADLADLRIEQ